jgi:hypothetical protein
MQAHRISSVAVENKPKDAAELPPQGQKVEGKQEQR